MRIPPRSQRCIHISGFHRLALVPVEIVYDPSADPPIKIKETRRRPLWLDTSDPGEDAQELFYETLLGTLWLPANLRSALLKVSGISRDRVAKSRTFSLRLEVNECRRRLRRERAAARAKARWGADSYDGRPIVSKPVQGNLYHLATEEVARKHNMTGAALRKSFERHRPRQLWPSR
jgi:hypothetical protein